MSVFFVTMLVVAVRLNVKLSVVWFCSFKLCEDCI
jgi:hypothetical protein